MREVCVISSSLMPLSLGGDGTDGNVVVLPFHPHRKSGYNGSFVLGRNRINMKAIALESKSNQAGSHSHENELIRKATCLLKGREIKAEGRRGGRVHGWGNHATAASKCHFGFCSASNCKQ